MSRSRARRIALGILSFSTLLACAEAGSRVASAQEKAVAQQESSDVSSREQKLAAYLTGVKFIGTFTVSGNAERPPEPESYYVLSAEKMDEGDWWKLTARIKYSTHDVTIPMALEIKWAGETPVITVDQMLVPGLGTFDARVLIRKGSYAGTWAHDEIGGQLFGRLEKMTAEELAEVQAEAEKQRSRDK